MGRPSTYLRHSAPVLPDDERQEDEYVPLVKMERKKPAVFHDNAPAYFTKNVRTVVAKSEAQMNGARAREPEFEYPCIDISSWLFPSSSSASERERVVDQVLKQAKEAGSFNISGHGISEELFQRLEKQSTEFFDMSLPDKLKYGARGEEHKGGYVPIKSESTNGVVGIVGKETEKRDLRELFSAVYPRDHEINVPGPAPYDDTIHEYLVAMTRIDVVLHKILARALEKAKGVSLSGEDFESKIKGNTTGLLRNSRYPKMSKEYHDARKLGWHSDWGTLTIIYSTSPGLEEIRNGRIIKVPVQKGQLHVNMGEVMSIASNMLFQPNIHAVSADAPEDRQSYSYFAGAARAPGSLDANVGIDPVCAVDESPMFHKTSSILHVDSYCDVFFST